MKWDRYQHNKTCIIPILILVCVAGQTSLVSFITARFIAQFMIFPPAKSHYTNTSMVYFTRACLMLTCWKQLEDKTHLAAHAQKKINHCTGNKRASVLIRQYGVTAEMKAKMKRSSKHRNLGRGIAIQLCKTEKLPGQIVHSKTTKLPHLIPSCTLHRLHEGNLGHFHSNRHLYCIMSSNK